MVDIISFGTIGGMESDVKSLCLEWVATIIFPNIVISTGIKSLGTLDMIVQELASNKVVHAVVLVTEAYSLNTLSRDRMSV